MPEYPSCENHQLCRGWIDQRWPCSFPIWGTPITWKYSRIVMPITQSGSFVINILLKLGILFCHTYLDQWSALSRSGLSILHLRNSISRFRTLCEVTPASLLAPKRQVDLWVCIQRWGGLQHLMMVGVIIAYRRSHAKSLELRSGLAVRRLMFVEPEGG
jgi:hypothetical protein